MGDSSLLFKDLFSFNGQIHYSMLGHRIAADLLLRTVSDDAKSSSIAERVTVST